MDDANYENVFLSNENSLTLSDAQKLLNSSMYRIDSPMTPSVFACFSLIANRSSC